jgi:biofilm protein TabA
MHMLGRIGDLLPMVDSGTRLRRGLDLLWDCLEGQMPEVTGKLVWLQPGETWSFPVEAGDLYLLAQCYRPKLRDEGRYEAHKRHTDLQFIWSGGEAIEVLPVPALAIDPGYDGNGNVFFPMDGQPGSRLLLRAGDVAVLSPHDAHAPCLAIDGRTDEPVRKIVVKIKDAHLPAGPDGRKLCGGEGGVR